MSFNSYFAIKNCISQAFDKIYDDWYSKYIQVAKKYEVFFSYLQIEWNRKTSKNTQGAKNKSLTQDQESAICKYINCRTKVNIQTCLKIVLRAANSFIHFENYATGPQ